MWGEETKKRQVDTCDRKAEELFEKGSEGTAGRRVMGGREEVMKTKA